MAPKEIPMATVEQHNKPEDLWVVIEDKVYDLTKFRKEHPGGEESLDGVAGTDATQDFLEVGHSEEARILMKKYFIGDLAAADRMTKLPVREIAIGVAAVVLGLSVVILLKYLKK